MRAIRLSVCGSGAVAKHAVALGQVISCSGRYSRHTIVAVCKYCEDGVDEYPVNKQAVDAVLTSSRVLVALATQSLGAAADDTTIAQYRSLVVLASRGPQRVGDLAAAMGVTPSTAGRMCDRLLARGLIRREHSREDRRAVQISITGDGRQVLDQATDRRRMLIGGILRKLPTRQQAAVAAALQAFAAAAGEIPDSRWPGEDANEADGQARPCGAARS